MSTGSVEMGEVHKPATGAGALAEEQACRRGAYQLLAGLLRSPPDQALLDRLARMGEGTEVGDEMAVSLALLGLAARNSRVEGVDDEFHELFIGLGRGELVPYGSWYLTGFLMERPLSLLRDELAALGYQRQADIREPEDHVAALCEVMGLLIDERRPLSVQEAFFGAHLAGWAGRFFDDLAHARAAVFYRAVGRLGLAFTALELRYLHLPG